MIWLLYFALIVYNGVDVYQTFLLFNVGLTEWNPLLEYCIEITGSCWAIVWIKALFLIPLGFLIRKHNQTHKGHK